MSWLINKLSTPPAPQIVGWLFCGSMALQLRTLNWEYRDLKDYGEAEVRHLEREIEKLKMLQQQQKDQQQSVTKSVSAQIDNASSANSSWAWFSIFGSNSSGNEKEKYTTKSLESVKPLESKKDEEYEMI
ncbi:hypothetical protein HK098_000324 [Nowakowskiella sp. JEL0407]|nr:hypothetical protein HK098_000324 [Nowakowskiella sp. JEL0407]